MPAYRVGYLNPWKNAAENQAFFSMATAAQRLGHKLIHVTTSEEILEARLDFVIATASTQAKTTSVPTFLSVHEPRSRFLENRAYFDNLLTYDGYLSISDNLADFIKALMAGVGRDEGLGIYYQTAQTSAYAANVAGIAKTGGIRLCYFGTNWDPRWRPLFRELSNRKYMRVYGPESSWAYLNGKAYCGSPPFDGESVQKEYARFGAGLVVFSDGHKLDDVISNRIFEITSVGAVAVCPRSPWIEKYFGDSVYYYDGDSSIDAALKGIDEALLSIQQNPSRAMEKAGSARSVFEQKFSAERMFENAVSYFESRAPTIKARDAEPLIDVIVRVGGRSLSLIERAVRSVDEQTSGRFRVVFVRYKAINLQPLTDQTWSKIEQFKVVDRIGGRRADTMIAGLRNVISPLFAFLDDDDFWLSHHIESLLACARTVDRSRMYAYSGTIRVYEKEIDGDRRHIGNLKPASGDAWQIMGAFAMNSFLASSDLLKNLVLGHWTLNTAEDSVLQATLMSNAECRFSYRASACASIALGDSSNFQETTSRDEDVLECFLRSFGHLERLERQFFATKDAWEWLRWSLKRVHQKKIALVDEARGRVVLQEGSRSISLHERTDIKALYQVKLANDNVETAGESRLLEETEGAIAFVKPPPMPWAYGLAVSIHHSTPEAQGNRWVCVELGSSDQKGGIGLELEDGSDFLTRTECGASNVTREYWLPADRANIGRLIFQNWDEAASEGWKVLNIWVVYLP